MTNIFDTHAHYSSRQFDADRAALLKALPAGGVVGVLECATHSGDAARVLELAHSAPYFHAAIGIHPESLIEEDAATVAVYHGDWRAELAAMRPLFEDKSVAAVGEIGLDHHWTVPRQEQYDLFEAQLQLAKELDLPVSVHDREAHFTTIFGSLIIFCKFFRYFSAKNLHRTILTFFIGFSSSQK